MTDDATDDRARRSGFRVATIELVRLEPPLWGATSASRVVAPLTGATAQEAKRRMMAARRGERFVLTDEDADVGLDRSGPPPVVIELTSTGLEWTAVVRTTMLDRAFEDDATTAEEAISRSLGKLASGLKRRKGVQGEPELLAALAASLPEQSQ